MIRKSPSSTRRTRALLRPGRSRRTAPPKGADEAREGLGHPHLVPRGWTIGRPVGSLIGEEPLPTSQAVAVTLAVLSGLGALHQAGQVHGGVSEASVGIGSDGWVRLALEAARDGGRGPAGDLADTGALLCRLLGIDANPAPLLPMPPAEKAAPGLVAVARALARGRPGWTAAEAWIAVKDAAGYWGSEPRLVEALGTLSERAGGASAVQRAVTRVIPGPPLRSEEPAPAPAPSLPLSRPRLPRVRLGAAVLPALATASPPALPKPALPRLRLPWRVPASAPLGKLAAGALVGGLLIGALAGVLGTRLRPVSAAATHRAAAQHAAKAAAGPQRPTGLYAQTPPAAVSMFFQLVQERRLDQAALLWKPKMAEAVDLQGRFGGVTSIDLRKDDLVAEDDQLGVATISVDWVETEADGSTHEYAGVIYADSGPVLWRWDSWNVAEVVAPPPANGGGDGGDGG